jgi:general secretion pathway protein C
MTTRLLTFVIWSLVAASAVFWANRFASKSLPVPSHAVAVGPTPAPAGALVRLFGETPVVVVAAPPPVLADARFKLLGVVAPRPGQRGGWALLVVDDKPARSFPLGGRVDAGLVVQSISHRQVELGPSGGPPTVSLSLPPVAEAARGVPSGAMAPGGELPRPAPPPFAGRAPAFGVQPGGPQPVQQPPGQVQLMPGSAAPVNPSGEPAPFGGNQQMR